MITGNTNGLSPLARGTHACFTPYVWQSRFIPAGAGNTIDAVQDETVETVYPRWRGEHGRGQMLTGRPTGLSPLARGTRIAPYPGSWDERFIPAGAGNTIQLCTPMYIFPVYPRWRGEHSHHTPHSKRHAGLSPLARGTH